MNCCATLAVGARSESKSGYTYKIEACLTLVILISQDVAFMACALKKEFEYRVHYCHANALLVFQMVD